MPYNPQAAELNAAIEKTNAAVLRLLSERGRAIFFPRKGILGQTADAKKCEINATIGSALEDDGSTMCLESIEKRVSLPKAQVFPYAPSFGDPVMREIWGRLLTTKNPSLKDKRISLPVVTCALTHGLSMAGYLFADEGDTVILPDLYWGNYNLIFRNAYGASVATYRTFTDSDGYNVEGFRAVLSRGEPGKRIVMLNFPNNPTGYTPTVREGARLCEVLVAEAERGSEIVVLVDDAYFGLGYEDGIMPESIFARLADAHERILACKFDGPTKEDYVWGFRVGFVTFGTAKSSPELYSALESKLAGAIRGNISNASRPSQSLLMAAYTDPGYARQKAVKFETLNRRYRKIRDVFASHPEYAEVFKALPFNSGYFMCVRLKGIDSEPVRQKLIADYSTGVIALEGGVIRVAFSSTPLRQLDCLFENIYRAAKDVAAGR